MPTKTLTWTVTMREYAWLKEQRGEQMWKEYLAEQTGIDQADL